MRRPRPWCLMLIVSPAYLIGAIPLGSLIQASLAFTRVEGAFAFCISPPMPRSRNGRRWSIVSPAFEDADGGGR